MDNVFSPIAGLWYFIVSNDSIPSMESQIQEVIKSFYFRIDFPLKCCLGNKYLKIMPSGEKCYLEEVYGEVILLIKPLSLSTFFRRPIIKHWVEANCFNLEPMSVGGNCMVNLKQQSQTTLTLVFSPGI